MLQLSAASGRAIAERECKKAYQENLAGARSLKLLGTLSNGEIAKMLGLTGDEVAEV